MSASPIPIPQVADAVPDVTPLRDRILVKRDPMNKMQGSLLHLPDSGVIDKPIIGKVLRVGPGAYTTAGFLVAPQVKVGDEILFSKYAGNEIDLPGCKDLLLMREDEVLAVVVK